MFNIILNSLDVTVTVQRNAGQEQQVLLRELDKEDASEHWDAESIVEPGQELVITNAKVLEVITEVCTLLHDPEIDENG